MASSSTLNATASTSALRFPASSSSLAKQCSIPRTFLGPAARGMHPVRMSCQKLNYSSSLGLKSGRVIIGNDPKRFFQGSLIKASSTTSASAGLTETPKKKGEVFDREGDLAASLAKYIADLSAMSIKARGSFNVALSGGTLIHSLRKLLEPPYDKIVEWSKWRVFWVDERVLPRDHIHSNYRVAYDNFLSRVPVLLRNVYAINDADAELNEGAADDYEGRLKLLVNTRAIEASSETECPKFDLMLLGMGPDGHVGSLFPGHALLNENERWVAYMDNSPREPRKRITMTIPVINACDHVALVVCGDAQADAVAEGWAETTPPPTDKAAVPPAQSISPEKEFFWFLDRGAASKLEKLANQPQYIK